MPPRETLKKKMMQEDLKVGERKKNE